MMARAVAGVAAIVDAPSGKGNPSLDGRIENTPCATVPKWPRVS